jgi:hypothetical protein
VVSGPIMRSLIDGSLFISERFDRVWQDSVTMFAMTLVRTVRLRFGHLSRAATTHTNLSAVRVDGRVLWIAGDETATVERLVADDPTFPSEYADEQTFRLADFVNLPGADADEEADIEGLARTGHFLWAVGSHSLRRRQIKARHVGAKALKRLARVEGQDNRHILVRLPIADLDGLPTPVREIVVDGERHRAAQLDRRDQLRTLLRHDEHLDPFLAIPGKDNGLDVEGIAVTGNRVYLGLRGPVLRGWAFVLELRPYVDPDEPDRLRLREFDDGLPYRKHVLDLDGLGVRDLCPEGEDLLVLAGPTMDLDGPVRIYRWHGARRVEMPAIVRGEVLTRELELTYGEGDDHAEGMGLVGRPEDKMALVVYDSPAAVRLTEDGAVIADVVRLPAAHPARRLG